MMTALFFFDFQHWGCRMVESMLIKKAKSFIEGAKNRTLSLKERKDQAISLAAVMLEEARRIQTPAEKRQQSELAGMMHDPNGKVFTTTLTDQCFRSQKNKRIANQLVYVMRKMGIPQYLPLSKKIALHTFSFIGESLSGLVVPLAVQMIRKETHNVILPGETEPLKNHMKKRYREGVRVNLNHLGEAILGEEEAKKRLNIYLNDLAKPEVEYISVKISTIYSQIQLLAWQETLATLMERLRELYRAAKSHFYVRPDGTQVEKFVNLDMEEYRDLPMTVTLFKGVLEEPEFFQHRSGIVLQSYLPDSFVIQQELTEWAMERVAKGGAPIKIRIVKGANLAMEQLESALRLWPQAPYTTKGEVDANFKRMINYACQKEHAQAAHIGIGSHNLFDIAYTLLLRAEKGVEKEVCFEMLEGMADHMRRVVQELSGDMLLYCPAATQEEFQNAVAYLVRRLDENTAPENFLRQAFDLKPGTEAWQDQIHAFSEACLATERVSLFPRRHQNRLSEKYSFLKTPCFQNEPDTDWTLPQNRKWIEKILKSWHNRTHSLIPLVINGHPLTHSGKETGIVQDPSRPQEVLCHYTLATEEDVEQAIQTAKKVEKEWSHTPVAQRAELLGKIAHEMRVHRGDLIGAMVANTGKTVQEADVEISEAIDFAEYYRKNILEWTSLPDVKWKAKGTVLVAPPWNFPCSISAGGILAALATGNCVIFKPATEAVLVGWELAQLFWNAGVSQDVLQFITCEDDPVGSQLVKDERISMIVLTGATETAKLFFRMRPGLDLIAETGGKNTMVISGLSDRDLAIKDLVHSAFGHAGQKCSACSLAILEAEVYDDAHFLQQLRDAAASLAVGSAWDLKTKVNPLIRSANETLMRGLTQLEEGETWLLEPKQDPNNPGLWSPGIKLGVNPTRFTFQTELFGPVLGLVRADSMEHAFQLMNQTPYGLTAGLHSLDEREQRTWLRQIEAGNCYINRTMTGAIVERQPFGGMKNSCFGKGAKSGGPNYLLQFMEAKQVALPQEKGEVKSEVKNLSKDVQSHLDLAKDGDKWQASVESFAFYWKEYFSKQHDPSLVRGQDNLQCYVPHSHVMLRVQSQDSLLDTVCVIAAAMTCGTPLKISVEDETIFQHLQQMPSLKDFSLKRESEDMFAKRVIEETIKRVRVLRKPSKKIEEAFAQVTTNVHVAPVVANGRIELLHVLREKSVSCDYHRYGNLGERELEIRRPLPNNLEDITFETCQGCVCHA